MKVGFYSAKAYEKAFFTDDILHQLHFIDEPLSIDTAEESSECRAVCCFATDCLNAEVLGLLHNQGV